MSLTIKLPSQAVSEDLRVVLSQNKRRGEVDISWVTVFRLGDTFPWWGPGWLQRAERTKLPQASGRDVSADCCSDVFLCLFLSNPLLSI